MKPSEKALMNAKWYCTNGMILTVLANVVENQSISLFTSICALLQFLMIAIELGNYRRYIRIEEIEHKEYRKRLKKIIADIDDIIAKGEKQFEEEKTEKKTTKSKSKTK